jgi:hypothetical protein
MLPIGDGDEPHLVAVVVPAEDTNPEVIQEFARVERPDYLEPSRFVPVENLLPNGRGQ